MLRENSFNGPLAWCLKRITQNSLNLLTLHDRSPCENPLKTSLWRRFFSPVTAQSPADLLRHDVYYRTPGIPGVLLTFEEIKNHRKIVNNIMLLTIAYSNLV